ncbi:MAG: diguanylate cyclase [Propionivibrio sp.]
MNLPESAARQRSRTPTADPAHRLAHVLDETSTTRRIAYGIALAVLLIVVILTETLLAYRASEIASQRNAVATAFASELRSRAERELNSVLYLTSGIVGYMVVRHKQIDPEEVNRILAEVYAHGRHIRNFAIAYGYKVAHVYPLTGNSAVLGRDYRDLPTQLPSVNRAIERRKAILTGPVALIQGGVGLIYRVPIFVDGQYWGMLSTVIDMESLRQAAFGGLASDNFEFALRTDEPDAAANGLIVGQADLFADPSAVKLDAEMPNGYWTYAVRAKEQGSGWLAWFLRGAGWLAAVLAALCMFVVLRQRDELAHLAGFDPLTALPNRRLFDDRLEQAIRRQARHGSNQVAAVFIDVNDFKLINDRYGHKAGDAVLRTLATRIREEMRIGDTVSRWAGDEFAAIVEDANPALVEPMLERLHAQVGQPFTIDGVTHQVRVAIGAAYYPDEADTAEHLLALADQRMYENKKRQKQACGER